MDIKGTVRSYYAERVQETEGAQSFGVGDPVELARLRPGETVLDLGSGPGHDLLKAATAVGDSGRAIGVDMTPEMLERARALAGANTTVLEGDLEALPLPCGSVDVVISNCVINLVSDKRRALTEAYRVLVPGGRLTIVDTAFEAEPPAEVRSDPEAWACCVGGALVADDYVAILEDIGFEDVRLERLDASCGDACSSGGTETISVAVTAAKAGTPGEPVRPAVPRDRPRIGSLLAGAGLPGDLAVHDALTADSGVVGLERHGSTALLRSLVVDPDRRGGSEGTRLAVAALEVARWSGADEVYLLTPGPTQRFFERLGFKPVSRGRIAKALPDAPQVTSAACDGAIAMRLAFAESDLPGLSRPRRELPTFQDGACC